MPRGGARAGAGRPRGSASKPKIAAHEAARDLAKAIALGPTDQTPLSVLQRMMNKVAALADLNETVAIKIGDRCRYYTVVELASLAADLAAKAAPFVHPRVAPVEPPQPFGFEDAVFSLEEAIRQAQETPELT
jgi:hypothetical protein